MPLRRPASLRRRKPFAMTGPAMPSRMLKEPKISESDVEKEFDELTGMLA